MTVANPTTTTQPKTGHTPGPWTANADGLTIRADRPAVGARILLAEVYTPFIDGSPYREKTEIRQANARLIAAAPELLAACKSAVENCGCTIAERDSGHRVECWAPAALEAIAKAEGGAS